MTTRRSFLAGAAGCVASLTGCMQPGGTVGSGATRPARSGRRLLVLGGTQYVGAAATTEAMRRGHDVTLFNRGITNPHLFPDAERLRGNRFASRDQGLAALRGRRWDAVLDISGYFPSQVRATAELLRSCGRYVFMSSIAVYRDFRTAGLREDSAVQSLRNTADEQPNEALYGARKAACEQVVAEFFPGRFSVIRAHAILGPYDPNDSLRYWAVRMGRGGAVLGPGTGRDPVQMIDVRDVARLLVDAAEGAYDGTFNAIGPQPLTMRGLLETCQRVAGRDASVTWVSEEFLRSQKIGSWGNMPLWAPLSEDAGFTQINSDRLRQTGFVPMTLEETVRGVLESTRLPVDYEFGPKGGISLEREAAALHAWSASPR